MSAECEEYRHPVNDRMKNSMKTLKEDIKDVAAIAPFRSKILEELIALYESTQVVEECEVKRDALYAFFKIVYGVSEKTIPLSCDSYWVPCSVKEHLQHSQMNHLLESYERQGRVNDELNHRIDALCEEIATIRGQVTDLQTRTQFLLNESQTAIDWDHPQALIPRREIVKSDLITIQSAGILFILCLGNSEAPSVWVNEKRLIQSYYLTVSIPVHPGDKVQLRGCHTAEMIFFPCRKLL